MISEDGPTGAALVEIRTFRDGRGSLSVVEGGVDLPFVPKRLYYLYGADAGVLRGAHAHRTLKQFLIALNGAAEIEVDDGQTRRTFRLERPSHGLLLRPVVWRVIRQLAPDTVLCVLASENYDEGDYIHDYDEFRELCSRS